MLLRLIPILTLTLVAPFSVFAAPSFSDVLESHEEYEAVEELKIRGIVEGRPDGTFGPDEPVNRAEAITIVVRAVANVRNLPSLDECFPDVAGDAWYVKPVCYAFDLSWVGGYPDGTFQPIRTVAKVEYLKILLNAYGVDTTTVEEFRAPLSIDVRNPDEWYMPYLSFALMSSMTTADANGHLNPGVALTRGQVALMMHRFLLYREGVRTQQLLTSAEKDIRAVFAHLDALEIDRAEEAVARARLAVFGAKERQSEAAVTLSTEALAESLRALVSGYRLSQAGNVELALEASQDAYRLADAADSMSDAVRAYTDRVRAYAHDLAEDIRGYQ